MIRVNRIPRALAGLGLLFAISSCAATGASATAVVTPPPCRQPSEAVLPNSSGSLDETSSGAYCVPAGQAIAVFLHAGVTSTDRWSSITSSDPRILAPQSSGILTAPVGVTPGIFGGLRAGVATLTSTRTDGHTWMVTIVVQ